MALIMDSIDSWNKYMDAHGDPRTKNWFMMSSPFPTLFVCLSYVFIVKVVGPRLMENRKPFRLQNTLVIYNALQVVFSAWIFSECLKGGWWGHYSFTCQPVEYDDHPRTIRIAISGWLTGHYSFRCQPVEYNNNPRTIRMVHACWWYYFSKFTEFLDTIFFIVRKKQSQVTSLHVIHHGCMPMSVWFGVKFTPGGHSTFFGLLNTFVHIIMYTYYMLSAMGPQFQKYLWWKKYLTTLQMVQFILIMVHAFQLLFIDCNYPKAFVWWIGMHAVMFFFLFNEFYKQAYKSRQMRAEKRSCDVATTTTNGHVNGSCKSMGQQTDNNITNGLVINGKLNGLRNSTGIGLEEHASNTKLANGSAYNSSSTVLLANNTTELTQRKVHHEHEQQQQK